MHRRRLHLESLEARTLLSADHVIAISIDGWHADALDALGSKWAPNLFRLRQEGATTDNARTDYDYTVTLPNHATQLSGRPVLGEFGHNLTENVDPGGTLHDQAGFYVSSVFDVAHDHGRSTGLYVSKTKFQLFDRSWNETHGRPDTTGADDGRDKIDVYVESLDNSTLVQQYVARMADDPLDFSFVHLSDPDSAGHSHGWMTAPYLESIARVDDMIGEILTVVESHPALRQRTAILVTTDHGGLDLTHVDPTLADNYTIPFFAWGPGVRAGGDLYALNPQYRGDPGTSRPPVATQPPPIRSGELANLALDLLGLPAILGSRFNAARDLRIDSVPAVAWWQNPTNRFDVNGDGHVFPLDALLIINFLNEQGGAQTLPDPGAGGLSPPPYVDVSGDNLAAPIDALMVINALNQSGTPAIMEGLEDGLEAPESEDEGELEDWTIRFEPNRRRHDVRVGQRGVSP